MTKTEWNGFKQGDQVVMLIATRGETADGDEVIYGAGSRAVIDSLDNFGPRQGNGVHIVIGESGRAIVNVFDDADVRECGSVPFYLADS